jgi:hypothetical protein
VDDFAGFAVEVECDILVAAANSDLERAWGLTR